MFHIMIVEDYAPDAYLIQELVKTLGYRWQVDWKKDGLEALEQLRLRQSGAKRPLPDLVLMDLRMPRLNGLETLRALKDDPDLRAIPVVMFSTSASPAEVRTTYQAHANSFVQKPSDLAGWERLVSAIEEFCPLFGELASSAASRGSMRCLEHLSLMEAFASAVRELVSLHRQQFEAAVRGDGECHRFDLSIHLANQRKLEAKYACLRHRDEHGCSNG